MELQLLMPDDSESQAMRQEPKTEAAGGGNGLEHHCWDLGLGTALKISVGRWVGATGVFDQPGWLTAGHTGVNQTPSVPLLAALEGGRRASPGNENSSLQPCLCPSLSPAGLAAPGGCGGAGSEVQDLGQHRDKAGRSRSSPRHLDHHGAEHPCPTQGWPH